MNPTNLSTKRQWIAELARRKPGEVLYSLHHVIDLEWMQEAYALTRKARKLPYARSDGGRRPNIRGPLAPSSPISRRRLDKAATA
jgi:hypothetical protein